jgi:NAD(P)-dependent dehydrogenase (short-subunit alcohol dehydrogenase family)
MPETNDRVALVTGASGALGGAMARRRLDRGERVALFDRRPERLARELPELASRPERAAAFPVDLADRAAVERAVGEVVARFGRIDAAFNLAGAFRGGTRVEETTEDDWALLLDANFRSTLHLCRAVVPAMRRQGGGAIVNVGSRAALAGDAGVAAYSVAKSAVVRLTESLAAEGKRDGIRVNCVLPGTLDTAANRAAMPDADPAHWVPLEALLDVLDFLASPAARAIHGAALPVFGTG